MTSFSRQSSQELPAVRRVVAMRPASVANGDSAGEVPAAVFVVEAVVGEAREDCGRAGGCVVAGVVFVADEAVGEREIEPLLVRGGVGPEGEVVGIAQMIEVADDVREGVASGSSRRG